MFFLFWFEGLQLCWGSNIKFLLYANFTIILKRCRFLPAFRIQHDCRLLYRAQGPNSVSPRVLITAHRKQCMEDKPVTSSVSSGGTQYIVRGNTVYRQGEHSVSSGGTRKIRLEPHVMPPHGIPKARIALVPWQDVGLFPTSWASQLHLLFSSRITWNRVPVPFQKCPANSPSLPANVANGYLLERVKVAL